MGLLKIIKKIKRKEREMRLLMLGLDNAGKTTVLKKFNGDDVQSVEPTLGFQIKSFSYKQYTLNVWDVGGQQTIRSYWRNYYEQTDGLVWVVDSADVRRLLDTKKELHALLTQEKLAGASLLVLANKQDIKDALTYEQIAKVLDLNAIAHNRHWRVQGCSAMTGGGLVDGVDWLVTDISSRIFMLE